MCVQGTTTEAASERQGMVLIGAHVDKHAHIRLHTAPWQTGNWFLACWVMEKTFRLLFVTLCTLFAMFRYLLSMEPIGKGWIQVKAPSLYWFSLWNQSRRDIYSWEDHDTPLEIKCNVERLTSCNDFIGGWKSFCSCCTQCDSVSVVATTHGVYLAFQRFTST